MRLRFPIEPSNRLQGFRLEGKVALAPVPSQGCDVVLSKGPALFKAPPATPSGMKSPLFSELCVAPSLEEGPPDPPQHDGDATTSAMQSSGSELPACAGPEFRPVSPSPPMPSHSSERARAFGGGRKRASFDFIWRQVDTCDWRMTSREVPIAYLGFSAKSPHRGAREEAPGYFGEHQGRIRKFRREFPRTPHILRRFAR